MTVVAFSQNIQRFVIFGITCLKRNFALPVLRSCAAAHFVIDYRVLLYFQYNCAV